MKLTYLGTAAAEGFPAVFCNCQFCNEARRLGGKNIRTRSQSLINDDMLIDLPPDTYWHFINNGIEGDRIKYLLITHAHQDHFYPSELEMRNGAFAHDMRAPVLRVFGSEVTFKTMDKLPRNVEFTVMSPFVSYDIDSYRVTPLPARHMPGGEPFIYIIENEGKSLLYANDTGYPFEEVFEYIEKNRITFDMVSFDCTFVNKSVDDNGHHMGFENIGRVIERLRGFGAITDSTVKYVNHFSHNGNPLQQVLEEYALGYGCGVSYDGCAVEF